MVILSSEKVYFRSQILERPSIGEYWNISGVPVFSENMIFMSFRTCWCYSEAYNTGTQKWSSIGQYSCTSIWDLKYTFSLSSILNITEKVWVKSRKLGLKIAKFSHPLFKQGRSVKCYWLYTNNILHVSINNSRNGGPTKIWMPFFNFLRHFASR